MLNRYYGKGFLIFNFRNDIIGTHIIIIINWYNLSDIYTILFQSKVKRQELITWMPNYAILKK